MVGESYSKIAPNGLSGCSVPALQATVCTTFLINRGRGNGLGITTCHTLWLGASKGMLPVTCHYSTCSDMLGMLPVTCHCSDKASFYVR